MRWPRPLNRHQQEIASYAAWGLALAALLGSLFLSEVLGLVPCMLCWWQRICVYPLVIVAGVGILRRDKNWPYYVLPLSLIGTGIAGYHTLLQWGVIPEHLAPCSLGVSCATKQVNLLGFITIPFLSLLTFVAVSGLTYLVLVEPNQE